MFLRARKEKTMAGTMQSQSGSDVCVQQIVMTSDIMLCLLISNVTSALRVNPVVNSPRDADSLEPTILRNSGNFSQCTPRFDGNETSDVEAFIDAVTFYRDYQGLPMLLIGHAATWWQETKSSITSFGNALNTLRHALGFHKPAYQIYGKLFSNEQKK